MKTNPEKFQAIAVGQQTFNENITFNLENSVITCEENVKLLGVTIDFKLNFDEHVSNVCKTSIKAIKCSKTDWKAFVQIRKTKDILFIYSLKLQLLFLTWHVFGEVNTKKTEKIQERALRFIYSVSNICTKASCDEIFTLVHKR